MNDCCCVKVANKDCTNLKNMYNHTLYWIKHGVLCLILARYNLASAIL